jgi:hypothetical protein
MGRKRTVGGEYTKACSCDLLCPCFARNNSTAATRNLINGCHISWGKAENLNVHFPPFNCSSEAT